MKDKKDWIIILLVLICGGESWFLSQSDPQPESQQYYMKLDGDFDESETKSVLIQKKLNQSDKHSEWQKVQVIQ
jgi:hypothetical protein